MLNKSNTITITVKGGKEDIPLSLEGIQLCIQNAERLLTDSQNVSLPSKVSLLEIGLEEISKAFGLLMMFEKRAFDKNPNLLQKYFKVSHIDSQKYNEKIKEIEELIRGYLSKDPASLLTPFNRDSFSNHKTKVDYLSKIVYYLKNIAIPIIRCSMDRKKLTKDLLGGFIPEINLEEGDKLIDAILSIDADQLKDMISLKEKGLYVDIEGDSLISPSSRPFYPEILRNLLSLFINVNKNELAIISNALA